MKKKILGIILFAIMFLPIISVSATCYRKCDYSSNGSGDCQYSTDCSKSGNITCRAVSSEKCGNTKLSCGNVTNIPEKIPELTSFAITVIQIAIPIVLVVMGSLDLFKGLSAQKEDEIKKGQQMFIKRLVYAAIIFFVIVVAKLLISVVADSTTSNNIAECIDCFLSGTENCRR